jgi:hypothetical protein
MITRTEKLKEQSKERHEPQVKSSSTQLKTSKSSSFESLLRQVLPHSSGNKVSEEELFSALIYERMHKIVGDDAAEHYRNKLGKAGSTGRTSSDTVLSEKVALSALKDTAKKLQISDRQADAVYSQAFDAANFDSIKDALYDRYSSKGDPTIALAKTESAINSAKKTIEKMERGSVPHENRSLASAKTTGNTVPAIAKVGDPLNIKA